MKISDTPINGLKIIELNKYSDERGFFIERYNQLRFEQNGLPTNFVQDNHSKSQYGVLRGLHYQINPETQKWQGKLVSVIQGVIQDVAVDLRPDSESFGKYFSIELSEENNKMLWIPGGFAHGFLVTSQEPAHVLYKTDEKYIPEGEGGIAFDDLDINIEWHIKDKAALIISEKDRKLSSFKETADRI